MSGIPQLHLPDGESNDDSMGIGSKERPTSIALSPISTSSQAETIAAPSTFEPKVPLLLTARKVDTNRWVQWGVYWVQPTWMVMFLIGGFLLAWAHHVYYYALDGTLVSSTSRQQWAIRLGTAFAYLTQSCLKASVITACTQCIWAKLRKKAFTVDELDKLFGITTDLTSFCSWKLLRGAGPAMLLAALIWVLPLTTIIPPATLSVVAGSLAQTKLTAVPTIDWAALDDTGTPVLQPDENPPPVLSRIVDLSSVNMDVVPLLPPAATSSYDLQFVGPTLQCKTANSLQQKAFDYYVTQAQYDSATSFTTLSTIGSITNGSLVYSGFVPAFYGQSVMWGQGPSNNFNATLGPSYGNLKKGDSRVLQLWVQLYNQSLVCTAVNASFDLTLQFDNSTQEIIERKVEVVGQVEDADYNVWINYVSVLHAMFDTLTGNVTSTDDRSYHMISSSIVSSGLVACDDITSSAMFHFEPWMCRNRSIARGIEDFANNVTIGILSIPAMTKTAMTLVTTPTPVIRYAYHRLNLILSYGLALTLSALGVLAGGRSFKSNGVTHHFSFSAIMTTTRSPDLASLCEGQSLGSLPLSQDLGQTKLSFGLLGNAQDEMNPDFMHRAGFGLEHKVGKLATGAKCI